MTREICGTCKHNKRDWTNPNNPDYYCNNSEGEMYGANTGYTDGCEDREEKL